MASAVPKGCENSGVSTPEVRSWVARSIYGMGTVLFVALFLFPLAAMAQTPSAKDVVAPTAFASYEPVARGMAFQVAVVLKIRPGFHVNAREVSFDYLIPTDLRADVPAGFKLDKVIYPKGTLQTFAFSKDKKLNVYTDTVILRLPLTVLKDAPLGPQHLAMKLRYQACSTEICLPPVTKDVELTLNVVAGRSSAKSSNPDLFPPPR
jgi:thiol:disulfide interchange protein